ncbi:hypothetical protein RCOM_0205910 [Ricinus communis]|uniref:Uncharacterized protein n=1 Tax=Ricinus communis TaxID=3988 RepID=B9SPU0_RICCO|nr:hypothetical protein RCOM_0205910 [Ricinus communis]
MAVSVRQMSLIVATLGALSFIFGIVVENKRLAAGIPIPGKSGVVCKQICSSLCPLLKFHFLRLLQHVLVYWGISSIFAVMANSHGADSVDSQISSAFVSLDSALFWLLSLMSADNAREGYFDEVESDCKGEHGQPAAGIPIPGKSGVVCKQICSSLCPLLKFHFLRLLQHFLQHFCCYGQQSRSRFSRLANFKVTSSQIARLLGGGAFVSLDSALFWLLSLVSADNAREGYFDEVESDCKGEHGQVLTDEYDDASAHLKGAA